MVALIADQPRSRPETLVMLLQSVSTLGKAGVSKLRERF